MDMSTMEKKIIRTNTGKSFWQKTVREVKQYKYIYIMMIPGLVFFLIFKYVPMYGIQLAFKDFHITRGIMASPWVGLAHFMTLFEEKEFLTSFMNTLIISMMKIVIGFPVPVLLAIFLNELRGKRYKKVLQTVYTFPYFLSWVIVSALMINLLSNTGSINNLLNVMGFERQNFLMNKGIFRYVLAFSAIWKDSGWSTIIYLAAITGIDTSLYEAATVDGANRLQKIRYITWPGIASMTIVMLILSFGQVMDAGFQQIFNMYNPTVYEVADIIDTYVYRITFQRAADFGFSTAVGLFKGVANMILLLSANKISRMLGYANIV